MNKQLKVVIADDTTEFGQKCAKTLKGYGMEVELCEKDGFEVIKTIKRQKPNVVVADVFMPAFNVCAALNAAFASPFCIAKHNSEKELSYGNLATNFLIRLILGKRFSACSRLPPSLL